MSRPVKKKLLLVFLLAFCVRLVFWIFIINHPERAFDNDSRGYLQLAETLLESHTFPSILRTPVYPFFIASVYFVFGKLPQAVLVFQYLLDSVTSVIVLLLFLRIFQDTKWALLAGFLYAINPFAVFYSNMILTETLFTFIFAVASYWIFAFSCDKRKLVLSSLMLGIGALCRPISLYGVFLFMPFLLFAGRTVWRDKLISCLMFFLVYFMILVPWCARNYQYYGQWTISTADKYNIFVNFAPEVLMGRDNIFSLVQVNTNDLVAPYQARMWNIARTKYGIDIANHSAVFDDPILAAALTGEGLDIIRNNSLIFASARLLSIGRVMTPFFPRFSILVGRDGTMLPLLSLSMPLQ